MDWIIFGDDWGTHPSTTQHIALNLPAEDSVVWVDSIGMRSPKLSVADLRRLWQKGCQLLRRNEHSNNSLYESSCKNFARLKPRALPWHDNALAQRFNGRSLSRAINELVAQHNMSDPILLGATPVISRYASTIEHAKLAYLRLDVYEEYPGCDPQLVRDTEQQLYEEADAIFYTAAALKPKAPQFNHKCHYIPQGVNVDQFSQVPLQLPNSKVLGFFGTLSEWIDFDLIRQVARMLPDWRLEFIGKVDYLPDDIARLDNVDVIPPVAFSKLPDMLSHWKAAWIPFQISELTLAVNPLKIREYLAAGIPSISTPLPELEVMQEFVELTIDARTVVQWCEATAIEDSVAARLARRTAMNDESWASRGLAMRNALVT